MNLFKRTKKVTTKEIPTNIDLFTNTILADNLFLDMNTNKTGLNNNVLVMGSAGSGKTRNVLLSNLLQSNCSFIVYDSNREKFEHCGNILKDQGYQIKVIDIANPHHSTDQYNPFDYLYSYNDVIEMANTIIRNTNNSKYSEVQIQCQKIGLILYIGYILNDKSLPKEKKTLSYLHDLLLKNYIDVEKSLEKFYQNNLSNSVVTVFAKFSSFSLTEKVFAIRAISSRFKPFAFDSHRDLVSTSTLDIASFRNNKTILFINAALEFSDNFDFLTSLIFSQIMKCFYNPGESSLENNLHIRFLLDQYSSSYVMPDLPQRLATLRALNMSCIISCQSLKQIEDRHKYDWTSLIDNCCSLLFLGNQPASTTELISKLIEKELYKYPSVSTEELNRIPKDECYLKIHGFEPIWARKYDLSKHPNFKEYSQNEYQQFLEELKCSK